MYKSFKSLFSLGLIALSGGIFPTSVIAQQDQVVLFPLQDGSLFEEGPLSNGDGQYLFTGRIATGPRRRALLEFATQSIPSGSQILSAQLQLSMSRTISGPLNVALHRMNVDWVAGSVDAPGQEGIGAPAEDGDATWDNQAHPAQAWVNPGGDFANGASATTTVIDFGDYRWDSPGMVADVQAWVDAPASNFGWIVIGDEGAGQRTAKRFNAVDFANADERPQLTVTFTPPVTIAPPPQAVPIAWPVLLILALSLLAVPSALRKF